MTCVAHFKTTCSEPHSLPVSAKDQGFELQRSSEVTDYTDQAGVCQLSGLTRDHGKAPCCTTLRVSPAWEIHVDRAQTRVPTNHSAPFKVGVVGAMVLPNTGHAQCNGGPAGPHGLVEPFAPDRTHHSPLGHSSTLENVGFHRQNQQNLALGR